MIKQVIDEKIRQNQELKEYFRKYPLDLPNKKSIIYLINRAINDLETIKFLYYGIHQLKDKENIKND